MQVGPSGKSCLFVVTTWFLLVDRTQTASGLQGWRLLVHVVLQVTEVGKMDPQRREKSATSGKRIASEDWVLEYFFSSDLSCSESSCCGKNSRTFHQLCSFPKDFRNYRY